MKAFKGVLLVLAIVGWLFGAVRANGQTFERGEIRGFVFDSSHSIVPKANVTISNPSTGYKRAVQTDETTGVYDFPELLPGVYKIRAEAEGFAPTEVTDINVSIGSSLSLDITLPIKGQLQTVTVAATVEAVDTTTAGINQVINEKNISELPLSGRDYRDLAQLSSSAEVVPGLRGGIRLGGQQSDYSSLVIDGVDSTNNFYAEFFGSLETKNFTIPLDSVEEFQVVTNGFAPEFGRATGGLINVVTKSGTNEVHGTAHYNARAGAMTETDALGHPSNINLQQQLGGTIGFPIHKDTQFLFVAFDLQRENGPLVTEFCNPGSGFADCIAALNTPGPTFSGIPPLPNNVLPAGCKSSTGSILQACFGVNTLAAFEGANSQFQNLNTVLGHWDWQFTPANHLTSRVYFTRNHTNGFTGGLGQNEVQTAFQNTENFRNQGVSGTLGLITVLGRRVNEFRVSAEGESRPRGNNTLSPTITINDPTIGNGLYATFGRKWYT